MAPKVLHPVTFVKFSELELTEPAESAASSLTPMMWGPVAATSGLACVFGVVAITGALPLPPKLHLPASALIAILLVFAASPVLVRSWRITLGVLLVWLVFEDLLRKMAGNDIRVYFIKDLIYSLLLIALLLDRRARGAWREATGLSRFPLYAMVAWAGVMAVPAAITDWRVPVIGLRLDFFYAPLVVVGFLLARESIKRLTQALTLISLVGATACAIGIVQVIVGPGFLAPSGPTPGLIHLILLRSGGSVYEPTGTFVDPGRFGSMAVIAVGVSASAFILATGRVRVIALATLLVSALAVWLSGGRSNLLQGAVLIALAAIPVVFRRRWRTLTVAGVVLLVTVVVIVVGATALFPKLITSRFAWYSSTLNPLSAQNEYAFRWNAITSNLERGINLGGWFGMGTGHESLGKQYILGGSQNSAAGLYDIEGGYAAVLAEWGLVGLALWLAWTVTWVRRQLKAVWAQRDQPVGRAGLVLLGWIVIFLFPGFGSGFQVFQNYLANAYFWLLSGVVFGLLPARVQQADTNPHLAELKEG